jgi:hypothetical protein
MTKQTPQTPSRLTTLFCIFSGSLSLIVPLVVTPITLFYVSSAKHPHPMFGWALCFYLAGFSFGVVSLILWWLVRRYALLVLLPVLASVLNAQCILLAFYFWFFSGMNIQ